MRLFNPLLVLKAPAYPQSPSPRTRSTCGNAVIPVPCPTAKAQPSSASSMACQSSGAVWHGTFLNYPCLGRSHWCRCDIACSCGLLAVARSACSANTSSRPSVDSEPLSTSSVPPNTKAPLLVYSHTCIHMLDVKRETNLAVLFFGVLWKGRSNRA